MIQLIPPLLPYPKMYTSIFKKLGELVGIKWTNSVYFFHSLPISCNRQCMRHSDGALIIGHIMCHLNKKCKRSPNAVLFLHIEVKLPHTSGSWTIKVTQKLTRDWEYVLCIYRTMIREIVNFNQFCKKWWVHKRYQYVLLIWSQSQFERRAHFLGWRYLKEGLP